MAGESREHGEKAESALAKGFWLLRHAGIYKTCLLAPPATGEIGRMRMMTALVKSTAPSDSHCLVHSYLLLQSGFPG